MTDFALLSDQSARCSTHNRRGLVRASKKLAGMDYVDVDSSGTALEIHFFGKVPEGLTRRNFVIEGGRRIRNLRVMTEPKFASVEGDTVVSMKIDREGDFSAYKLCVVEPEADEHKNDDGAHVERKPPAGIDPRYSCVALKFRGACPDTLDCKPAACAPEPQLPALAVNYLAHDFSSFRQLILDRLLVTMPSWRERNIPDIGITLVELLAYAADQLSYALDAVATEAYLGTAHRRISVRRHARLVDYRLHEGCNARAWLTIHSDTDKEFEVGDLAFAVPPQDEEPQARGLVDWNVLQAAKRALIYEPIDLAGSAKIALVAAHSSIRFYTWEEEECCLPKGTTSATLLDEREGAGNGRTGEAGNQTEVGRQDGDRPLRLSVGDFLIFEEICGPRSGALADADPSKRHVVRLTKVERTEDPLNGARVVEINWHREDALPFTLCLSSRTDAPECKHVVTAVARGNVVLVDHGVTTTIVDDQWVVGTSAATGCCGCEGAEIDVSITAAPFSLMLPRPNVTHSQIFSADRARVSPAAKLLVQDPRQAVPIVQLDDNGQRDVLRREASLSSEPISDSRDGGVPPTAWRDAWDWVAKSDLLGSGSRDRHIVAEIDDEGFANLRFGDNDCGRQPEAGLKFRARCRIGGQSTGNVGAESIVQIAMKNGAISGLELLPRNPLPATGGLDAEPIAHAKAYAPHAYSRIIERAVAARDYAELALRDPRIEGAYAELRWTGSWYEADVAIDQLAAAETDETLTADIELRLERARRIGHDLRIVPAEKVPIVVGLAVCVKPRYSRSDVELAIRDLLSNGTQRSGELGIFHHDRLEFGTDIKGSRIVSAVQKIDGVQHVELTEFRRLDTPPNTPTEENNSLMNNFIAIARHEIAQLDNDPNAPEKGSFYVDMQGGL